MLGLKLIHVSKKNNGYSTIYHRIIPCVMSCHIICHVMSYHIIPRYIISYNIMSCVALHCVVMLWVALYWVLAFVTFRKFLILMPAATLFGSGSKNSGSSSVLPWVPPSSESSGGPSQYSRWGINRNKSQNQRYIAGSKKNYNDVTSASYCLFESCAGYQRQSKHQSSASLPFLRGIHQWPVDSHHKGPVMRKGFHDMTSSCLTPFQCKDVIHTSKINQILEKRSQ